MSSIHDLWSDAELETSASQRQLVSDRVDEFVLNADDNALVKAMLAL